MPDYKESTATARTWQRARAATVQNDYKGVQQVIFQEEKVIELPDGTAIRQDVNSCGKVFKAGATFPLLDPATGEPTGETGTHDQLYQLLFSVYMQTVGERDAFATAQKAAQDAQAAANALIPGN